MNARTLITMTTARRVRALLALALAALAAATAAAQTPAARVVEHAEAPGMVSLDFPENLSLKVLIDYVSARRGVNFIYDDNIANMRVTLKAPARIPAAALMTLLESVLKMKGMTLTASDTPGLMRIALARSLTADSLTPGEQGPAAAGPALAVTRIVELRYATAARAASLLEPFLSAPSATLTPLPEQGLLVVTDYAANIERLEGLLAVVDRPGRAVIRFVSVEHQAAADIAGQLTSLLAARQRAGGAQVECAVLPDPWSNQLALVGPAEQLDELESLADTLDVPLGLETRYYRFTAVAPDQVDELMTKLVGDSAAGRLYRAAVDRQSNQLIVAATPGIHEQLAALAAELDQPVGEAQSPVRFYKLENSRAADVLATLQGIEGESGLADVSIDGVRSSPGVAPASDLAASSLAAATGRAAAVSPESPASDNGLSENILQMRNSRIMADEATNTLIVVASPTMQRVYEKLIRRLDVRRPQVLIEATVVAVDTSDGFKLGVEVYRNDHDDEASILNFTQYGLSTFDPVTGLVSLKPGEGFNGAVLNAELAQVVIQALESDSRARVVSRPTVLVNDNATGSMASINEAPYGTVSLSSSNIEHTTLGGYSRAGTEITVKPQISQGDHLRLEFNVTLSSFTDEGSDSLPPARQNNELASDVTIPNGQTIVVGGLSRDDSSEASRSVPWLGRIPVLGYLFSSREHTTRKTTLFIFLRAVILRDDMFADLKLASGDYAASVGLPGDFPLSEPVLVK